MREKICLVTQGGHLFFERSSLLGDRFVEVEQYACHTHHGSVLGGVKFEVTRSISHGQ